jgi:hypothetical protein
MPIALKRIFEREYGLKRGDRIFYSWENKRRTAKKKKKWSAFSL